MTGPLTTLVDQLKAELGEKLQACVLDRGQVTIEIPVEHQLDICTRLRDDRRFAFEQLIDLCGVDYAAYGEAEWTTEGASGTGFSRGVEARAAGRMGPQLEEAVPTGHVRRFAVVMQLLSVSSNRRLRVRVFAPDDALPVVKSVGDIWASADWFEREAFDLYGIVFEGHPDLRRLLTDYGFIGHPFRKDFPLTGNVEVRYDPEKQRVIYQPVTIEPRVLVPKVIRAEARPETAGDEEQAS